MKPLRLPRLLSVFGMNCSAEPEWAEDAVVTRMREVSPNGLLIDLRVSVLPTAADLIDFEAAAAKAVGLDSVRVNLDLPNYLAQAGLELRDELPRLSERFLSWLLNKVEVDNGINDVSAIPVGCRAEIGRLLTARFLLSENDFSHTEIADLFGMMSEPPASSSKENAFSERQDRHIERRIELAVHTTATPGGTLTPDAIIDLVKLNEYPALAITDRYTLRGYLATERALRERMREEPNGFTLIPGMELRLRDVAGTVILAPDPASFEAAARPERFVGFDWETTGLDPQADRPIEVGAVRFERQPDGSYLPTERYEAFIDPERPLPAEVTGLTGISQIMIDEWGRPEREVLEELVDFIGSDPLCAHNAPFDLAFLQAALFRHRDAAKFRNFRPTFVDTLSLSRLLVRQDEYNLAAMAKLMGIELHSHHRAADDARATGEILAQVLYNLPHADMRGFTRKPLSEENSAVRAHFAARPTEYLVTALALNEQGWQQLGDLTVVVALCGGKSLSRPIFNWYRSGLVLGRAARAGEGEAALERYSADLTDFVATEEQTQLMPPRSLFHILRAYDYYELDPGATTAGTLLRLSGRYRKPLCLTTRPLTAEPDEAAFLAAVWDGYPEAYQYAAGRAFYSTTDEVFYGESNIDSVQLLDAAVYGPRELLSKYVPWESRETTQTEVGAC